MAAPALDGRGQRTLRGRGVRLVPRALQELPTQHLSDRLGAVPLLAPLRRHLQRSRQRVSTPVRAPTERAQPRVRRHCARREALPVLDVHPELVHVLLSWTPVMAGARAAHLETRRERGRPPGTAHGPSDDADGTPGELETLWWGR